ncbi:uncharacterized protein C18orf63 homolog isoform X2 [Genypterus blacodes]|uniref:uncharacterized protein C18orf63 homolog isoform X2 n=1 Tax=Genypterus blacodes TaxID=154954 RepID=UPI003F75AC3D
MSRAEQSLFFLSLPELKTLCCVSLSLEEDEDGMRSRQIKMCRELVLLYSDILASPALDSLSEITVVMAISFFRIGVLQAYGQRRSLQMAPPQHVLPGVLQYCLSYSLITRLAPNWNKAGLYLISGMELSTREFQMCISVEVHTVRLPPTTLVDFDLPPLQLRNFCSQPDSVLYTSSSTGGAIWCYVLPSMKKGQITSIRRQLPKDTPFRSYTDLKNHWNSLYGYRLPELAEEEVVYCSVYFKLVGERHFTYPLSCIRLKAVQRWSRVDLQGALGPFISDVRDQLRSVCGFPARLTRKPCYHTASLTCAASVQVLRGERVNLSTVSSARPVLTQLPAPRPAKPHYGSQPPAWPPISQQAAPQGVLGSGYGLLNCHRDTGKEEQGFSSSSSFPLSSSFPSTYQATPVVFSSSSFSSSSYLTGVSVPSSSFVPLFQTATSLAAAPCISLSSSSSSVLCPLPPPRQLKGNSEPKFVPIFKNKCQTRHVNIALLRAQKKKKLIGEEMENVSLLAIGRKKPADMPLSSSSSSVRPQWPHMPPPPTIPPFNRQPEPHNSTQTCLKLNHVPRFGPAQRPKPPLILNPKPEIDPRSERDPKASSRQNKASHSTGAVQNKASMQQSIPAPEPPPPPPLAPPDIPSSRGRDVFEFKPKTSRSAIQDVDVEKMARSNQLSKVNSATLLAWLKGRGVTVRAKHRKDELMLKVMGCLAEV